MKKKKIALVSCILLTFLSFLVFSGAQFLPRVITLSLRHEDVSFSREYAVPFSRALTFSFYRKNAVEMCRKRFSGDANAFFDYLNPSICEDVTAFCRSFDRSPVEPSVLFDRNGFSYRDGANGLQTNINETISSLLPTFSASVRFHILMPTETIDDLKARTVLVSSFSTSYASSSPERKKNVSVASSRLSGVIVLPRGELSFNAAVGARTKENGFFDAPVIENGVYATGVGGGVCQVATTLYDAWLLSGQNAALSRPHSLLPHYVLPGLDAMVSSSGDLILSNPTDYPFFIRSFCDGKTLTFEIYGKKPTETYSLGSELVRTIPYDEYDVVIGEEEKILAYPVPSRVYRSYRTARSPNGSVAKEYLRLSHYLPQKGKKSVKKEYKKDSLSPQ